MLETAGIKCACDDLQTCNPLIKDGHNCPNLRRDGGGIGCLCVLPVRRCADDGVVIEKCLGNLPLFVVLGKLLGCCIALQMGNSKSFSFNMVLFLSTCRRMGIILQTVCKLLELQ